VKAQRRGSSRGEQLEPIRISRRNTLTFGRKGESELADEVSEETSDKSCLSLESSLVKQESDDPYPRSASSEEISANTSSDFSKSIPHALEGFTWQEQV